MRRAAATLLGWPVTHLHEDFVDIVALGVALAYFMSLLGVAMGCLVVAVMKGPRRTADSYSLPRDS